MAATYLANNRVDPCSVFFNGFASNVKPSQVSNYFHGKGYNNRVLYQRVQTHQFRLYMALKFENINTAKDICDKFNKSIIFGYKVLLSFFKKSFLKNNSSYPFMQDRLRKMRAQANRRPFFKKRYNNQFSPARNFRSRSRRRSRSSSSDSDRSISPDRKRRARSRERGSSKRRDRSQSRSRSSQSSRSSRSKSRSQTPNRFSLSPSSSKISNSSVDRFSDKTNSYSNNHKQKMYSKVSMVDSKIYGGKRTRPASSESQEGGSLSKRKQPTPSPSKERFLNNFSPVSCTSDDDVMLASVMPGHAVARRTAAATVSSHPVKDHPLVNRKRGETPEVDWGTSEGDSTPIEGTPSPRGPGLSALPQLSHKPSYSVYGKFGTFKEVKATDRPWQLKPLTIRDESSTSSANQTEMPSFTISVTNTNAAFDGGGGTSASTGNRIVVQNNRVESPYIVSPNAGVTTNGQLHVDLSSPTRPQPHLSPHEGGWSPSGGQRLQSPTTSSALKVNGLKKPGQPDYSKREFNQDKLDKLKDKKEEIIKAYKQDCDTFATVVRMLVRKDPGLEQRLQQALRDNLTEIGQRCVQELQDVVDQMKD